MKNCWLPVIGIILFANVAHSQDTDSLLFKSDPILAELDSILHSEDSLSILSLIDSILAMPEEKSQLAVRFGYNSNVASAGRTLNVSKFGLSPALSFYHKSGAYGDLAAYWSKEYETELYLTILSAGYLATITKNWSVMAEYGHYFYTPVKNASTNADSALVETPYTNNIYISNFLDAGKFTFRIDYSLLFGGKTAHRISPVIGFHLTKKKLSGIDRITWFPSANLMFGDGTAFEYYQVQLRPPQFVEVEKKVWGIMNYALSSPVSITVKNWSFLLSYTYNFPQSLPGEDQGLTHGGYVALSVTKYFNF